MKKNTLIQTNKHPVDCVTIPGHVLSACPSSCVLQSLEGFLADTLLF